MDKKVCTPAVWPMGTVSRKASEKPAKQPVARFLGQNISHCHESEEPAMPVPPWLCELPIYYHQQHHQRKGHIDLFSLLLSQTLRGAFLVAARSAGAQTPDLTVIRHGGTAALPGDSKGTVEVDRVANEHSASGRLVCDLDLRTAGKDSHRLENLVELATVSLNGRLDTDSSLPSDDCVILMDGQGIGL